MNFWNWSFICCGLSPDSNQAPYSHFLTPSPPWWDGEEHEMKNTEPHRVRKEQFNSTTQGKKNNNSKTNKRMYRAITQWNCSPLRSQCSARSRAVIPPPCGQLTQLYSEHQISPLLVQVICHGCTPSQLLVKINSIPVEPRISVNKYFLCIRAVAQKFLF